MLKTKTNLKSFFTLFGFMSSKENCVSKLTGTTVNTVANNSSSTSSSRNISGFVAIGAFLLLMSIFIVGCGGPKLNTPSSLNNQEAALLNPPVQTYAPPAVKTEGSLFSEDTRPDFFSDMKAQRVGDIITINIVETSRATKQANTSLGRNSSLNAQVETLFGLPKVTGAEASTRPSSPEQAQPPVMKTSLLRYQPVLSKCFPIQT
jgi:hypothetical protein